MRKLLLFSSVCVISAALFAQNHIHGYAPNPDISLNESTSVTGAGIKVDIGSELTQFTGNLQNIIESSDRQSVEQLTLDASRASEQAANIAGIGVVQDAANLTALSTNDSIRDQQTFNAEGLRATSGVAEQACSAITSGVAQGDAYSRYIASRKQQTAERAAVLAGASPISANGLIDYQRQMFDRAMQFCSQSELGGDAQTCAGPVYDPADEQTWDAFEHVNVGTLIQRFNVGLGTLTSGNDVAQLEYMEDLLYGRVPASLNADLMNNPNTDIKNLYVEADRIRAELSIGQTAFTELKSLREPLEQGSNAASFVRDTLEMGDYIDPNVVEMLSPENRPSLRAQLEMITVGQMNPNYLQDKLVNNPELSLLNIAYGTALNNRIQMYQANLLEIIALAVSTDIAASRYDAITELNAKIREANGQ